MAGRRVERCGCLRCPRPGPVASRRRARPAPRPVSSAGRERSPGSAGRRRGTWSCPRIPPHPRTADVQPSGGASGSARCPGPGEARRAPGRRITGRRVGAGGRSGRIQARADGRRRPRVGTGSVARRTDRRRVTAVGPDGYGGAGGRRTDRGPGPASSTAAVTTTPAWSTGQHQRDDHHGRAADADGQLQQAAARPVTVSTAPGPAPARPAAAPRSRPATRRASSSGPPNELVTLTSPKKPSR